MHRRRECDRLQMEVRHGTPFVQEGEGGDGHHVDSLRVEVVTETVIPVPAKPFTEERDIEGGHVEASDIEFFVRITDIYVLRQERNEIFKCSCLVGVMDEGRAGLVADVKRRIGNPGPGEGLHAEFEPGGLDTIVRENAANPIDGAFVMVHSCRYSVEENDLVHFRFI